MTATVAPIEKLRAAYQQWHDTKGGSIDTWLDLMADKVRFHSLANGAEHAQWSRQRRTPLEIRGYLIELTSAMKMVEFSVDRFVCQGDTVVMIGSTSWINKATHKPVTTPKVDVWRFNEAGKAIEYTEYYDTAGLAACCNC